ncbi:citryl-CoA lyase [Ferrovibrio sp.]|uniref:citryl-CoA lyase n=1 Tax=Ferrovibrio sp. TaxID=1917215 RepID=UPI0035B27C03
MTQDNGTNHEDSAAKAWWRTSIIDIAPGVIRMRGYPIEQLIGNVDFPSMVWLMLRGELPTPAQAALLQAVLVSAVDHGPQAPSIAMARMSVTCGVGINHAIASGVNALGDVHGGAGTQCMELLQACEAAIAATADDRKATALADHIAAWRQLNGKFLPGFGHRFHPVDPRTTRLTALLEQAVLRGEISGRFLQTGKLVQTLLAGQKPVPMNIDGITAVVLLELGFPSQLGRGIFVLSRSVGICAHAWEQSNQGGRIKGPLPPSLGFTYDGPAPRDLPASMDAGRKDHQT